MDVLDSYKIDLKNMRTDVAEYQFALDDAFFEAVEGTLVKSGKADADLKIRESGGAYVFTIILLKPTKQTRYICFHMLYMDVPYLPKSPLCLSFLPIHEHI